ncbi:MAG: signal peptidase I, partial [Calditrichaceae bacterium]
TEGLLAALIAALIIRQLIIQAYTIPTSSMEDTLLVGDFLLVNKFTYGMRTPDWIGIPYTDIGFDVPWFRFPAIKDPEPYDVIIFRYPKDVSVDYIKRCIATEGQTVEIVDKKVFVDGKPFPSPPHMKFIDPKVEPRPHTRFAGNRLYRNLGSRDNYGPITIPEDSYWAMGDNRDNSLDSRYWGFVREKHIVGQGLVIYFSWNHHVPLSDIFHKIRFGRIGQVIR